MVRFRERSRFGLKYLLLSPRSGQEEEIRPSVSACIEHPLLLPDSRVINTWCDCRDVTMAYVGWCTRVNASVVCRNMKWQKLYFGGWTGKVTTELAGWWLVLPWRQAAKLRYEKLTKTYLQKEVLLLCVSLISQSISAVFVTARTLVSSLKKRFPSTRQHLTRGCESALVTESTKSHGRSLMLGNCCYSC